MSKVASETINRLFAQYIAERNGLTVEDALARIADGTYPRAVKKVKKKVKKNGVKPMQAPPKKKSLTTAQRIARRLGPEGRRGGGPMVQGGAPGLGKRR